MPTRSLEKFGSVVAPLVVGGDGPLAELPRGPAVGKPLDHGVELARLEVLDAQRLAAPGAPEIEVAEPEARVARQQRVRRLAPRRGADLDPLRP